MRDPIFSRAARRLDEAGQSTIEFALTLMLLMGFVLFYLQLTFVFAFGNYVHYATFMAARAYLAAGDSPDDQEERARQVIAETLKKRNAAGIDRFPAMGTGVGGSDLPGLQLKPPREYDETNKNLSWLQGVRYSFRSRLFMLPLGGFRDKLDPIANSVTLTSESWLGKEPSFNECAAELKARGAGILVFDNGC